jgi:hypothetical protein
MKNRKLSSAIVALSIAFLAAACMPKGPSSQEIATDLHNYTLEMQKWEPKEKTVFQAIDDVEQSQYVDDEFVARTLKSALPTLQDHVREVSAFRPATAELGQLHDHYKKGWEDLQVALDVMIAAETKKDYVALAKGKNQLNTARALLMRAFAGMDALMQENDDSLKNMRKS